ncbi:methionine ABC transporter ATP-binding protein [Plantibacter sp. YIM 135249]|uniref:methionine ABC transporter ATP-binding protein n=1 Tax=Plantibacter sp. YIM 135249 TaxID=3423918 RepID=UPI003D3363F7
MASIIEFQGVSKTFPSGNTTITAVDDVDLAIEAGEIFGIIGYSGAGKSTLVRLINGLERATSGTIRVGDVEITALSERQLPPVRGTIGMIFQQFNLLRSRTIAGNVEFPLRVAGWPKAKRKARVAQLLDFVGLLDRAHDYPEQLSGGQKQRVGIARALAVSPSVLLADEATSALDPETTQDVLRLLTKTNRELGVTIVVITHEMDVIREIADRVAVLDEGRVVELGSTYDVFAESKTATARRFLQTVVRTRPSEEDLARIRRNHPGRVVIVDVDDIATLSEQLAHLKEIGVGVTLAFGGIDSLQDREFGSLTLSLTGDTAAVDRGVAALRSVTSVEEVAA